MTSPSKVISKDDLLPAFSVTATLPPNLSVIVCPRPRALGRYPQIVQYSIVTMPAPSWGELQRQSTGDPQTVYLDPGRSIVG